MPHHGLLVRLPVHVTACYQQCGIVIAMHTNLCLFIIIDACTHDQGLVESQYALHHCYTFFLVIYLAQVTYNQVHPLCINYLASQFLQKLEPCIRINFKFIIALNNSAWQHEDYIKS